MTSLTVSTSRHDDPREIRFLARNDPGFQAAMRLILCGDPRAAIEADRQVEWLVNSARQQNLYLGPVAAAYTGSRLLTAVLVVESPGLTGLLYFPPTDFDEAQRAALSIELIPAVLARAAERKLALVQGLIRPQDRTSATILESSGFGYLTELVYMIRRATWPVARLASDRDMEWVTYDEERRDLFISALDESYVDTMDCRGLSGLRRTSDVLEGHRATGVHDPSGWFVLRRHRQLVGVVLTAQTPGRSSLEVVYMGVSRSWRGQGVGDLLLTRAVQRAQALRLSDVTLAVDGINIAARRLYERWGFVETARRRAWIICPSKRA